MFFTKMSEWIAYVQHTNDPTLYFVKTTILALLIVVCFRYICLGSLFRRIKLFEHTLVKAIRRQFNEAAWAGWFILCVAIAVFEVLLINPAVLIKFAPFTSWLFIIAGLLIGGVLIHLYTFINVVLTVFEKRFEVEKN